METGSEQEEPLEEPPAEFYDQASDIWGIGVIMFQMVQGGLKPFGMYPTQLKI